MLKFVTIVVAGLLSIMALRQIAAANEAAKARVKAKRPEPDKTPARLRQDPKTGVYFPED